jgi:hypothetical protein
MGSGPIPRKCAFLPANGFGLYAATAADQSSRAVEPKVGVDDWKTTTSLQLPRYISRAFGSLGTTPRNLATSAAHTAPSAAATSNKETLPTTSS